MSPAIFTEDKERLEDEVTTSLVAGYLPCPLALRLSARHFIPLL
jgi:hypothetical protein